MSIFDRASKKFIQEVKTEAATSSVPVFRLLGALLGLYFIFNETQNEKVVEAISKNQQPVINNVIIFDKQKGELQ